MEFGRESAGRARARALRARAREKRKEGRGLEGQKELGLISELEELREKGAAGISFERQQLGSEMAEQARARGDVRIYLEFKEGELRALREAEDLNLFITRRELLEALKKKGFSKKAGLAENMESREKLGGKVVLYPDKRAVIDPVALDYLRRVSGIRRRFLEKFA